MVSEKEIRERFSGLLDDETLEFLILYSMEVNSVEGIVSSLRIRKNKKGILAILNVSDVTFNLVKNFNSVNNIKVIIKDKILYNLLNSKNFSRNSKIIFKGYFSGDLFYAENFEIVEKGCFDLFEGLLVKVENGVAIVCENSEIPNCLACLDLSKSLNQELESKLVKITGVLAESNVMLVKSCECVNKKNENLNIFVKISDVLNLESLNSKRVCVRGRVSGIGELKECKSGEFASLYVSGDGERVRVVLWGESVSAYKDVDVGTELKIFGSKVINGELHCDNFSILKLE